MQLMLYVTVARWMHYVTDLHYVKTYDVWKMRIIFHSVFLFHHSAREHHKNHLHLRLFIDVNKTSHRQCLTE